jgi:hypothetical protein
VLKITRLQGANGTHKMKKLHFSKGALIAAAATIALSLSAASTTAVAQKKAAAKSAPPPGPGLCTANVNTFKMGYLNYRTTSGALVPTVMWCPEATCPAKC